MGIMGLPCGIKEIKLGFIGMLGFITMFCIMPGIGIFLIG
jgi:hypothetical protein